MRHQGLQNTLATDKGRTSDAPSTYRQLIPKVCIEIDANFKKL